MSTGEEQWGAEEEGESGLGQTILGDAGYADNDEIGWMRRCDEWQEAFSTGAEKNDEPPKVFLNEEDDMKKNPFLPEGGEGWVEIDLGVGCRSCSQKCTLAPRFSFDVDCFCGVRL